MREGMLRTMLPIAVVAGVVLAPSVARPQEKFSLKSVSVDLPASDRIFPNGHGSDATNENCLICHSAGMVLTQPGLSKAQWQAEVDKMRTAYKAPIDLKDVDTIVDYLVSIRGETPLTAGEPNPSRQPDLDHGAAIAAEGTQSGSPPCAPCHASNGASDGSGAYPRIAGLPDFYFAEQLRDYASGVRQSEVMSPIAKALSTDDVADVTAYYSGVSAPFPPLAKADPSLVRRGKQLATMGDPAKDIPACNNCHGPNASGEPPAIPYLAGQYKDYIALALHSWRGADRKNSHEIMLTIASKLDDQDVAALAAYFQQLPAASQTAAPK
jgi:cytochrome c553